MVKPMTVLLAALSLPALLPRPAFSQQPEQPVYTFVAGWTVPRAQWTEFASFWEKNYKPVLDRMLADGTLVEWGRSETVVHTDGGSTHMAWWAATSLSGTQRVLTELLRLQPSPAMLAATGHRDLLLRSLVSRMRPGAVTGGYLQISSTQVQAGKGQEWRGLWEKYTRPVLEGLFANGTIAGYGIDVEHVHTGDPAARYSWILFADAEALDKAEAAFEAARQKTPMPSPNPFLEVTVAGTHRDMLERVVYHVRK